MNCNLLRVVLIPIALLSFALAQEDPPSFELPYEDLLDPTNGTDHGQILNATRLVLKFDWSHFAVNESWVGPHSAMVRSLLPHVRSF